MRGYNMLALALALAMCLQGIAQRAHCLETCPKESLLFQLAREHGQYESVVVGRRRGELFDFTSRQSGAGAGPGNATYDRFIVTFDTYKFGDEHRLALEKHLPSRPSWKWEDRKNEASKYTTDFGVVRLLAGTDRESLIRKIEGLSGVKGVFEDKDVRSLHRLGPTVNDEGSAGYRKAIATHLGEKIDYKRQYHNPGREWKKKQPNALYQPEIIWREGFKGQGIRVGVFDTGLKENPKYLKNVKYRSNWTFQPTKGVDGHNHGTSSAGSIASTNPGCPSQAPEVDLYTFKVFTDDAVSYSSWYLDAINFAFIMKVHMINVSIGGPDFKDFPFIEKFRQLVANGVSIFCAMGNFGPLKGSINSPSDEPYIIAVGSHNEYFAISDYQSRGMTLSQKPYGYGLVKPDIVSYADKVFALNQWEDCFLIQGTSTACPVAVGSMALIASTIPEEERYRKVTPASIKQFLIEGADRLDYFSMYHQGPGALNLLKSYEVAKNYEPRVSVLPSSIDLSSEKEVGYYWPHSVQPIYAKGMPLMVNFTIINGLGTTGYFTDAPRWNPSNRLGNKVRFQFDYANVIWPWQGYLGVYMHVEDSASHSTGIAEGAITFNISSPPFPGEKRGTKREQRVSIPIKLRVIPTPPRSKRVLWDDFHNLQYPDAYVPKDASHETHTYDFQGDHPHTNYHNLYDELVGNGYYVEVLSSSMTCFDASEYGMLVIVDPEMEFDVEEIDKLYDDVVNGGLGLLVLGEWYDKYIEDKYTLFNPNYRMTMYPAIMGANVPALNRLLSNFEVAFSNFSFDATLELSDTKGLLVQDGTSIAKMPPKSVLFEGTVVPKGRAKNRRERMNRASYSVPILGMTKVGEGNIVIYADSSAFDEDISDGEEFEQIRGVFTDFARYASEGVTPSWIDVGTYHEDAYAFDFDNFTGQSRGAGFNALGKSEVYRYMIPEENENLSREKLKLLSKPLQCFRNAPLKYQPDRSDLVRKRNNSLMSWMEWARKRLIMGTGGNSNGQDSSPISSFSPQGSERAQEGTQRPTQGDKMGDAWEPRDRVEGGPGLSGGQVFVFFVIVLAAVGYLYSRKRYQDLRAGLSPRYGGGDKSV